MSRVGQNGGSSTSAAELAAIVAERLGQRSIVIVGLMGCGKTSVGRRVANQLGLRFVDSDNEIEVAHHRMTIPEIFEQYGEPYFRAGERRVVARLLRAGPQVLATGGGAFMDAETRANVRAGGVSVWLRAELPLLMRRVAKRSNRPLLKAANPTAVMQDLMDKRYPIYAEADVIVDSRDEPHDVMAREVIAVLAQHLAADRPIEQRGIAG